MTRDGLIEVMARAQARSAWDRSYRSDPNFSELYLTRWPGGVEEYLEQKWPLYVPDVRAALAAIEAAGVRLVPVEASCELEFARMADGTVKVGHNPRTEEGGWTLVGDVTKSVTAIEAQRDQALRDLDIANQRLSNVFAALAASPYDPAKKDETK